jgi:hypothetical protein
MHQSRNFRLSRTSWNAFSTGYFGWYINIILPVFNYFHRQRLWT